jgi:membrane protease YdiL (CAAX protease family)
MLEKIVDQITSKLASKNRILLIIFALILTLAGEILIRFIYEIFLRLPEIQYSTQSLKSESNFGVKFFFIFLLAPILETLFFQTFLIGFLSRFIPLKACFLISVILFGFSHFYTLSYIISTLYMGCILSLSYIIFSKKKQCPTFNTTVIHGLRNLIALIATYLSP